MFFCSLIRSCCLMVPRWKLTKVSQTSSISGSLHRLLISGLHKVINYRRAWVGNYIDTKQCIWCVNLVKISRIASITGSFHQLLISGTDTQGNYRLHIDGLMQGSRNSIANALELRFSSINPSICIVYMYVYIYIWLTIVLLNCFEET